MSWGPGGEGAGARAGGGRGGGGPGVLLLMNAETRMLTVCGLVIDADVVFCDN